MSVSEQPIYRSNDRQQKNMSHDVIIRSILQRLDNLEQCQIKSYQTPSLVGNNDGSYQLEKMKKNMISIVNSNLQNLKRLEQSNRQNWESAFDRIKSIETRTLRIFKQKQESLQYLDFRTLSVENSQRNVTQFMRKIAENETQKYSGLTIIQQRIKQTEHLGQLRDQKQADNLKIMESNILQKIDAKIKDLHSKIQQNKLNTKSKNTQQQKDSSILQNKVSQLQKNLAQHKQKISKHQQVLNQLQEQFNKLEKKLKSFQKQFQTLNRKQNRNSTPNVYKTQNNQKEQKYEYQQNYRSVNKNISKNTQNNFLKPAIPAPRSFLNATSPREFSQQNKPKPSSILQNRDDPFVSQTMGAGIRGLLRKSKQKQTKIQKQYQSKDRMSGILPKKQNLQTDIYGGRSGLRNLPPVKADYKKTHEISPRRSEAQQEQEEQVYQIDEEGYLVDQQGNYLFDEDGNKIQLSEEQFKQLADD